MKTGVCPIKKLVEFIEGGQKQMPQELKEHVRECKSCQKLLKSTKDAKIFAAFCRCAEELKENTKITDKTDSPVQWQVWSYTYKGSKKYEFGIISQIRANTVKIVPLYLNYHEIQTAKDDIKLPMQATALYLPALAEYWNEIEINSAQLKECCGSLKIKSYIEQLKTSLNADAQTTELPPIVKLFRGFEIEKGKLMQAECAKAKAKAKKENAKIMLGSSEQLRAEKTAADLNKNETKRYTPNIIEFQSMFDSLERPKAENTTADLNKNKIKRCMPYFIEFNYCANVPCALAAATDGPKDRPNKELESFFNELTEKLSTQSDVTADLMGTCINITRAEGEFEITIKSGNKSETLKSKGSYLKLRAEKVKKDMTFSLKTVPSKKQNGRKSGK